MEYQKLSLLRQSTQVAQSARLLVIALRLGDATEKILDSRVINNSGIQDEDFKAAVTESAIYLQIPEDAILDKSKMMIIVESLLKLKPNIHDDVAITLYAPTVNLPHEFVNYKKFMESDVPSYRMLLKFIRR